MVIKTMGKSCDFDPIIIIHHMTICPGQGFMTGNNPLS